MLLKIILYSSITLILFTKVCWSEETTKIECPCLNNGTCFQESNSSIHCNCFNNFSGPMCEFELCDDKNNKQCHNGTCIKDTRTNKQFCKCKPTHEGALCENEICSKYCYNDGSCSNGFTESTLFEYYLSINYTMNFTCKCQSDRFSGDKCEFDLCADKVSSCPVQGYLNSKCECIVGNECDKEHCNSKGNCTSENGKLACKCLDHYSGPNCENYDCVDYCLNNGTCEIDSITNNRTCNCLEGFNGTRCEFEIVFNPIYQARSYLKFIIYSLALTLSIFLIAIGCGYSFQNGNLKNVYLRRNLHRNLPRMPNIYPFGRKNHGTSLIKGDFSFNKLEDEEILVQSDHLVNA